MASDMQLHLVATLLRRGVAIDRLSGALTLLALVIGLAPLLGISTPAMAVPVSAMLLVFGVLQKIYALRVAIDAELFAHLATAPEQLDRRTVELDQALVAQGQPADKAGRTWEQRSQGALTLLRRQALCCGLQLLIALSVTLLMPWLSNVRFG